MSAQGEFDFEAGSAPDGYSKWLADRKVATRELARRLNLPLDHEVEVWLMDGVRARFTNANALLVKKFVIIDGELAWEYEVFMSSGRAMVTRVDARELDPSIRPKLDAARAQVEKVPAQRGIRKGPGYARIYDAQVQSIMVQEHGLRLRSFDELNPGFIRH